MQERAGGIKDKEDRETAASLTGPFNQSHSLSLCEWGFHSTAREIFSAQMYHRFNPHMVSSIPTVEKCICSHICVGEDGRCRNIAACALLHVAENVLLSVCAEDATAEHVCCVCTDSPGFNQEDQTTHNDS